MKQSIRSFAARNWALILAAAVPLLAAAPLSVRGAAIYYVGTLTNSIETVNWLTPSTTKTYDIDGDNVYGTFAGVLWVSYGNYTASTIGYAGSGSQYQQPEYPLINSLADACQGNTGPGAALTKPNPVNINASITLNGHTFVVNADLTGVTLRVGVMTDCLGSGEGPTDINRALVVIQTVGGTARSVVVPIPNGNHQPDMTFFDIVDAQVGDRYAVNCMRTTGSFSPLTAYVGDFSWDISTTTAVPATQPVILNSVGGATVRTNGGYHLAALAGGAPTLAYQWYKGTTAISGATNATYDLGSVTVGNAGDYSVVVSAAAKSATSAISTVSVVATNLPTRITGFETAAFAQPGLYAYYSFENLLADSAGTNNGSFGGTPGFGVSIGSGAGLGIDKGLACNGGDGRVQAAPDYNLDFYNLNLEGTICAWIRPGWNQNLQSEYFIANGSTTGRRWAIGVGGNRDNLRFSNGAATGTAAISQLSTTNWYFVSAVFSNGTYRLFLNGALVGSGNQSLGSGTGQPLIIGAIDEVGGNAWSGGLDEVAIYTAALPDSAIAGLYNAYLASDPPQITVQPDPGNFYPTGMPLTISLTAAGSLLHYQWYQSGGAIAGATTTSISFASLAAANAGTYACVVTNLAGSVTSSPCVIRVGSYSAATLNYDAAVTNTASLISFYRFDNFTANDYVDVNNGTMIGTTAYRPGIAGGPDQAAALNGTGFVELGPVSDFNFSSGSGTVELWLKANSISGTPCVFASRQDGSAGVDYSIHLDNSGKVYFWNGSSAPTISLPAPTGTAWHHMAVIFDAGTWTVVWDGVVAGTGIQYLGGAVSPTHLGSSNPTGTELWNGSLDEVAFYSTALTPGQIAAHYTAFVGALPPVWSAQPSSQVVMSGNGAMLSGSASGLSVVYQWLKNGVPLLDATNSTLGLSPATLADSGAYQLVATNPNGSITSVVANVSVVMPQPAVYAAAVVSTPGLISRYPFDAGNADDAFSTNNGTAMGMVAYTNGVGGGLALALDGISWVTFGSVPAFDALTGTLTVETWVRADWDPALPPGYNPVIFGNSLAAGTPYLTIRMSADKNSILSFGGAVEAIPNAGTNWHHLVAVLNNPLHQTFWDGQPLTPGLVYGGTPNLNYGDSLLGTSDPNGANYWIGAMDNAAYYATALSPTQVYAHYYAMLPPVMSVSAAGHNVTVSWPAGFTGWALEGTLSLAPANWTTVTTNAPPAVLPASGQSGFFRLRKL